MAGDVFNTLIINPGGYAHTSVAIKDALEECKILKIEVHISNLSKREDFSKLNKLQEVAMVISLDLRKKVI